jgi:hypothetical protein
MVLEPFLGAFGMPPKTHLSDDLIVNSMPIAEIIPCRPNFARGITLFSVTKDTTAYDNILKNHGFELARHPIRVAFIADNFPTDSFSNEYGETFLQKFTDVGSQGLAQIAQIMGAQNAIQGGERLGQAIGSAGEAMGEGALGKLFGAAGGAVTGAASSIKNFVNALKQSGGGAGAIGSAADRLSNLLAGHRVDFPQVWRNSAYSPSYTMTVRLYNPNPGNAMSVKRHIVGPLAVLLALAMPRSSGGSTYNWPFFHKIKCKGIYNLDPAVITNITVVKGGDQQQISYAQTLSIVDVRIDFGSVFNSILSEEKGHVTNRPTLKSYLDSIEKDSSLLTFNRSQLQANSGTYAGESNSIANRETSLADQIVRFINNAVSVRQGATSTPVTSTRSPFASEQTNLENETQPGILPTRS